MLSVNVMQMKFYRIMWICEWNFVSGNGYKYLGAVKSISLVK